MRIFRREAARKTRQSPACERFRRQPSTPPENRLLHCPERPIMEATAWTWF